MRCRFEEMQAASFGGFTGFAGGREGATHRAAAAGQSRTKRLESNRQIG